MGLEVGWYLRFPRGGRVLALVDTPTLPQIENQLQIVSGWDMAVEDRGNHALVTLTQKK